MKKTVIFALSFFVFAGCKPETKVTGRVIDFEGPVPEAAALGMVWIEDAEKAKPAISVKELKPAERDLAYEKDMKERGLPMAYARTFTDKQGWFELKKLHFSKETKKAVKAMKQPRITRVTVWAFQAGYLKQAVTAFPEPDKELPYATILMFKPVNWKEQYLDSTVDSLTVDYMVRGYSKEFGATKPEKSWILECIHANQWKAYQASDIKDDWNVREMCGRDYSDVIISSDTMRRNPEREKCGELLKRMDAIRSIEELWINHAMKNTDPLAAAKELVKQALTALPAEITEPKQYESMISAGLEETKSMQDGLITSLRNGLNDKTLMEEAQRLYNTGEKAGAYRSLGKALYAQIPLNNQELIVTEIMTKVIPGIQETITGFYKLMNRPQTAQLPGDNGNNKDKPKEEIKESTETVKDEGGFIRLEEEEITLFDENGKEIEKRYVSELGNEKSDIIKQVREKVLKKMGIKPEQEIEDSKLWGEYYNERRKFIKTKKLKPDTLKFFDKNNRLIKEITIGYTTVISTIPAETINQKSLVEGRVLSGRRIEQRIMRQPFVTKSQKAAVITETIYSFGVGISSTGALLYSKTPTELNQESSSIEYYNTNGNMRWRKSLNPDVGIFDVGLSENGEIFALIQGCELHCWRIPKGTPSLVVFDSSGKELLSFPSTTTISCDLPSDLWVSLDGNYIMFSCLPEKGFPKSNLINIRERKIWKAPYLMLIGRDEDGYEIREGSKLQIGVTGDNEAGSTTAQIDLEKLPWEPLP